MSDSPDTPWSDGPNAPRIPYWLHLAEGGDFAGFFIGMILYGRLTFVFVYMRSPWPVDHLFRDCHRSVPQMYVCIA